MATILFIVAFLFIRINGSPSDIVTETTEGIKEYVTQGYRGKDNAKCFTDVQYIVVMDSFIKHVSHEIHKNKTNEAIKILNVIAPEDDLRFEEVVEYTMSISSLKLSYLLKFINETTSPHTRLNGFSKIYHRMKKTGTQNLLDWLNLEYYFVSGCFSGFESIEVYDVFLSEIQTSAKDILMKYKNFTVADNFNKQRWSHGNTNDQDRYRPHHLSFIIKTYFNENLNNIQDIIRFLEKFEVTVDKLIGFIELYNNIESTGHINNTFTLIPGLKTLNNTYNGDRYTKTYDNNHRRINEFFQKLSNNTVAKKIVSNEYFVIRNVLTKDYLYFKESKRSFSNANKKSSNFLRTVSDIETRSEYVNWKFSSEQDFSTSRFLLTLTNENNGHSKLVPVKCLVHDESVLLMGRGNYHDKVTYGWNIETDDFYGDKFRIRNAHTNEYLSVRAGTNDNPHEPNNVFLVSGFNIENYDSVHWTLEPPADDD